jgi:hypothetical protein
MSLPLLADTIPIAGRRLSRLSSGTWGNPTDRGAAILVLRRVVHTQGIAHIAPIPGRSSSEHSQEFVRTVIIAAA